MSERVKIDSYQGLRGIAFILIFVSHCTFSLNAQGTNSTAYFGSFGVSLFIVLSGFLTTYNHYDENKLSAKNQIRKTIRKCYPLHLLTFLMAIPFSIKTLIKPNIKAWITAVVNLSLMQSWIPKSSVYFSYNAVSWYLSTYLFLMFISPLIVRNLKRSSSKKILFLLTATFSIELVIALFSNNQNWAHWIVYICPITRSLDFISGGYSIANKTV